jgi:hypothetical protein
MNFFPDQAPISGKFSGPDARKKNSSPYYVGKKIQSFHYMQNIFYIFYLKKIALCALHLEERNVLPYYPITGNSVANRQ